MDGLIKIFIAIAVVAILVVIAYTSPLTLYEPSTKSKEPYLAEKDMKKLDKGSQTADALQAPPLTAEIDEQTHPVSPPRKEPKVEFKNGVYWVGWDLLYSYDFKTKKVPQKLKEISGKKIRIPGYIVSLSDDYTKLDEFLLVPDAQSCIHVPPPPPNLIVWVKLKKAISADNVPYPAWVTGIFSVETTKSRYGNAAYKMKGLKVEQFQP